LHEILGEFEYLGRRPISPKVGTYAEHSVSSATAFKRRDDEGRTESDPVVYLPIPNATTYYFVSNQPSLLPDEPQLLVSYQFLIMFQHASTLNGSPDLKNP
jgi:hypothetical protein